MNSFTDGMMHRIKWYQKWTVWKTDWWKELYGMKDLNDGTKSSRGATPLYFFSLQCFGTHCLAFNIGRRSLTGNMAQTWSCVSDFFFPSRRWRLSGWKPHWYSGFVRSSPGCRNEAAGPPLNCNLIWFGFKITCHSPSLIELKECLM